MGRLFDSDARRGIGPAPLAARNPGRHPAGLGGFTTRTRSCATWQLKLEFENSGWQNSSYGTIRVRLGVRAASDHVTVQGRSRRPGSWAFSLRAQARPGRGHSGWRDTASAMEATQAGTPRASGFLVPYDIVYDFMILIPCIQYPIRYHIHAISYTKCPICWMLIVYDISSKLPIA